MVGLVRRTQDGTVTIGGRKTSFRLERGTADYGPWLLVETDASGVATVRPFESELDALMYVVRVIEP